MTPRPARWRRSTAFLAVVGCLAVPVALASAATATPSRPSGPVATVHGAPAAPLTSADLPDPTATGPYGHRVIEEAKLGLADIEEPDSSGGAPAAGTAAAPEKIEIRGQLYMPDYSKRKTPSPLIVLVHGNHGSCDAGQNTAADTCTQYKHNEDGYAYLAQNLATWGYTTFSISQDQLMMRQDNNKGKGMHDRRMLIAATLDALSAASKKAGLPLDEHTTIGTTLSGHLDMTRIGLMGHSRGGDAVSNFLDYNRIRTDGPRYPIRGVISLAPVDYERKAPYGMPFMTILPMCDSDVSNLQGARLFERSQYISPTDPFPRIQVEQLGAIHNWYNSVWYADWNTSGSGADGENNNDAACGNSQPHSTSNVHPNNLRLSGAASYTDPALNYTVDDSDPLNPDVNTKISGDPERMGDQEKLGLATMAAFFRRYVGGEGAFEPYMTGQLSDTSTGLQIPPTACPTSPSGTAIPCDERVNTTYFGAPQERADVIRPEIDNPLTLDALGGALGGSGFADPYAQAAGVSPKPAATAGGYDWCNPEPKDFAPSQLGIPGLPTAAKPCPLPAAAALGGQNGTRENSPINESYGRQLSLAWDQGSTAHLDAQIPAASKDMSGYGALAMDAAVNFFDTRNPGADDRGDSTKVTVGGLPTWPNELPTSYDPTATTQDFKIVLTDTAGHQASVDAGDPRWGNALHMSTGTLTANTHVVLDQVRVPLTEFTKQGVDVRSLSSLSLRFGEPGTPQSGSIQLADVRFQETTAGSQILSDGYRADGAGYGPSRLGGPDPATVLRAFDNTPGDLQIPDVVGQPGGNTTWTVDDDRKQCPDAQFTSIQSAVDYAQPWDTIVVCAGTYQESSTPTNSASNPVAAGATNGLTITKPLKIKGAGADKVTIEPVQTLTSLAGSTPYLRDGGGNVITVSRQSLGSTDTNEMFVDISGVTVTSGKVWAEAGVAYFGAAGRISDSVIGPLKTATTPDELAAHPHGWGVVKTGLVRGAGPGTVESELTVTDSVVTGYQSGGILFDGARGPDGSADNTVRTGIRNHGYVSGTVVTGTPNSLYPQVGVKYTSGVTGFVDGSRITGNLFRPDPSQAFGVLLADAGTDATGGLAASGDVITGNGVAVSNATADGTAVRSGAPFTVSRSYLGKGTPVVSGADASGAASVVLSHRLGSAPRSVPTSVGHVADSAPTAAVIDPGKGAVLQAGATVHPLIGATDDFAVRSATLLVDGVPVGTSSTAPYGVDWTPGAKLGGKHVTLSAVVTDSSGRRTTSRPVVVSVAKPAPPAPTLTVGKVTTDARSGTATVVVTVSTGGTVTLSGEKVAGDSTRVAKASTVALRVEAAPRYRQTLATKGTLPVTATVTLDAGKGRTVSRSVEVTLVKKR